MKRKMSQEEMICTMGTLHYMMIHQSMFYIMGLVAMFFLLITNEIFNMTYFFIASITCFWAGYWLEKKIRRFYKRLELR